MAAVGGTLSALEVTKIAYSITKALSRFYNANSEFSKYYVEYQNVESYLEQNLDCSQQHPHLVELNGVIRCYLRDMKARLDSFRAEMNTCSSLIKGKGRRGLELRARFKWVLKVRERAIASVDYFENRKRFLEVTFGLKHGLIDMSYYLRETAQGLSKEQTTEILDKFAEFEATYTSETRKFRNALVEEKKSRKSFFGGFKKRNRASRAIKQSNDSTPFSIELESTSSVTDEGILRDEDYMTEFMEQADDGLADKEEDIQQILDQISLPGGCSKCDSEMESICVAEGETLQSVDIGHYTSTTVSSDDEDDISGDQDEEFVDDVSPGWPEDAFKDQMTNLDILQTWRDTVLRIIDEENRLRFWLQEWPEEIHRMFEDDTTILSWLQDWPEEITQLFSKQEEEIENANEWPESSSNDQTRPSHMEVSFIRQAARVLIPVMGLFL